MIGQVVQDHAGLGQALAAVLEHRHLAHLVDLLAVGSGVRVSPPKKSTKRGSHFAPHRLSISATLNALPDCAKQ